MPRLTAVLSENMASQVRERSELLDLSMSDIVKLALIDYFKGGVNEG